MPSRRHILAASGVAVTTGTLGSCLSRVGLAKTGDLHLKVVTLEWEYENRTYIDQPLWIGFDPGDQRIYGRYDPAFVGDSVRSPVDIVMTKDRRQKLSSRFAVKYLLGICGKDFTSGGGDSGCQNRLASQKDFNRVQLNDGAEVRLPGDRFDVIDVYEDSHTVRSSDLRTFDFAKLHEDDGISPEKW